MLLMSGASVVKTVVWKRLTVLAWEPTVSVCKVSANLSTIGALPGEKEKNIWLKGKKFARLFVQKNMKFSVLTSYHNTQKSISQLVASLQTLSYHTELVEKLTQPQWDSNQRPQDC